MTRKNSLIIKAVVFLLAIGLVAVLIVKTPELLKSKSYGVKKSGRKVAAPLFSVSSINYPGKVISLKDYRGKVVLLNFFGTWCPPCKAEIPAVEKFYESHKKEGFAVIGLSVDNRSSKYVGNFVKKFDRGIITYPVGMADYSIVKKYGNIYEIPQSFIIDRNGDVVAHFTGELPRGYLSYEFKKLK